MEEGLVLGGNPRPASKMAGPSAPIFSGGGEGVGLPCLLIPTLFDLERQKSAWYAGDGH